MARRAGTDPDVLEYRDGGGCASLLGVPFLMAGAAFAASLLSGEGGWSSFDLVPLVPLTLGLLGVGAVLLFGRSRMILDRRERVAASWWGMLGLGRWTVTSLEGCRVVSVGCETRGKGKQRRVVHPVKIEIEGRKKGYEVCAPQDADEGRARGEEVAKFLGLGLAERTTGTRTVREAGNLDESLRDRLRRGGRVRDLPERPSAARSRLVPQGSTVRLDVPASGFVLMHKAQVGFGVGLVVVGGVVLWAVAREGTVPAVVLCIVGAIFAVTALILFGYALTDSRVVHLVEVSPAGLVVERRGVLRTTRDHMPVDEIEELEVTDGILVARSDRRRVELDAGLEPGELRWIKAVIESALVS